jgi:hypothetical protein
MLSDDYPFRPRRVLAASAHDWDRAVVDVGGDPLRVLEESGRGQGARQVSVIAVFPWEDVTSAIRDGWSQLPGAEG